MNLLPVQSDRLAIHQEPLPATSRALRSVYRPLLPRQHSHATAYFLKRDLTTSLAVPI